MLWRSSSLAKGNKADFIADEVPEVEQGIGSLM